MLELTGAGLVSYYLYKVLTDIGYTNTLTQNLINGCLQIFNLIVAVGMCFFVDKIGRRKLFLISTAGMFAVFIVWTICSARYAIDGSHGAANAVIAMIFLYYLCYNTAWSGLLVGYTVEILPYNIRAKGMTIMFLCVDLALFFNQYVNPIALDNLKWKYYIFYCVWLGVELAVVYFFYIETRNTPLGKPYLQFLVWTVLTRMQRKLLSTSTAIRPWWQAEMPQTKALHWPWKWVLRALCSRLRKRELIVSVLKMLAQSLVDIQLHIRG